MSNNRDFAAELTAAREAGDWVGHERIWEERRVASVEADEASVAKMFKLQTPAKTKSGWRTLSDGNWFTRESAERYGLKYHTTRDGARLFRIVEA